VYGIPAAYMSFSPATNNMLPLVIQDPFQSSHGKAVDSCGGWCHMGMYSSTRDNLRQKM